MRDYILKARLILKLFRLKTLVWFCVFTCLGFATVILQHLPPIKFYLWILTVLFANIGAIIVNDLSDVHVDRHSLENAKRLRPITSGAVKRNEAIVLCILSFSVSLGISLFFGLTATFFAIIIIVFSLSYSLPPFKFCATPYGSLLYWILLCIVSYASMILALQNIETRFSFTFTKEFLFKSQGILYMTGILLFMGIAEILAKDIRDLENDVLGGRNTFVNYAGILNATVIMIVSAWIGLCVWIISLYVAGVFPNTISSWLCLFSGLLWCFRVGQYSSILRKNYQQTIAAKLHGQWTVVYALMQLFTIVSFME